MSDALAFTRRAGETSVVQKNRDLILAIAKKSSECALFARDYARTTGFSKFFSSLSRRDDPGFPMAKISAGTIYHCCMLRQWQALRRPKLRLFIIQLSNVDR